MSEPCAKRKRTTRPIDGWEDHAARVKKQRLSEDSVKDDVRRQHARNQEPILHAKVPLNYPATGPRIDIPVRSANCKHAQCFDLAAYLKERDRNLLGESKNFIRDFPLLTTNGWYYRYFEDILRKYAALGNIDEVEMLSDGSYRAVVQPKVEVIPVSESPFIPPEGAANDDEKPPTSQAQDPFSEDESSSGSVHNTDLDLEGIKRLPETNQLCKDAKRKLLEKFKRDEKRKKLEAEVVQRLKLR